MKTLLSLALALVLAACSTLGPQTSYPPIVFVHGNGDTAALWMPTVWRFESNGWPRDRLFALDAPNPLARTDDAKPQEGRTGTAEHLQILAGEVERVRKLTGAEKVILVGNSRGGNVIRNYIRNGGGPRTVSAAVLGGATNHGVWSSPDFLPGSEFNGAGPFMKALNSPQGPDGLEVTPGVRFMTLRSDNYDKFTQPDGRWIGQPKMQTHTGFDAPALKGAENVVLPGRDHREVSYSPQAFAETWRFLTGQAPASTGIKPQSPIVLDGRLTGFRGNDQTNLPLPGAALQIYETSCQTGERSGAAALAKTVGTDGRWGPFTAKTGACYEFVIQASGFAVTHIYRSPFPRSSSLLHMRPARLSEADRKAGSVVTLTRPRGYFGLGRDQMNLDGKPLPGVPAGVAGVSAAKLVLPEGPPRSVAGEFNGERIVVRTWPAHENHAVFAELTY